MNGPKIPALMRVPPPLLFVLAFFLGVGLQRLVPLPVHSIGLINTCHAAGIVLIVCGFVTALSAAALFARARTTIIPFGTASTLLTRGPYRFTRNPMYLSLVVVYVGAAVALLMPWPLLILPLPVVIVDRIVIPFEESRLHEVFATAYDQYCAQVPRWM